MKGQDLLQAGYKRTTNTGEHVVAPGSQALWQKRVDDDYGKRYYINFYEYDVSSFRPDPLSYECRIQFHRGLEDEQTISTTVSLPKDATVADYEAFVEELFVSMGFNHYDATYNGLANRPAEPYKALQMAAEAERAEIARWITKNGSYDGIAADVGDMPVADPSVIAERVKDSQEALSLQLGNEEQPAAKIG